MADQEDNRLPGTRMAREELRMDERYLVEDILPVGEVHLIGGASGAGKTTWLLQWLRDWSEGKPVFGKRSYPVPFVYVSFDRGLLTLDRTLRRIGMEDWDFPAYSIEMCGVAHYTLQEIAKRFPQAKLIVVEGFQSLLPDTAKGLSQNKTEMLWMGELRKTILAKGKTIIGVTHSPKMKQGESYVSTRSRFLGSNSMLASTGTLIQFDIPERPVTTPNASLVGTDDRVVLIEGPNFQKIVLEYTRDSQGKFVLQETARQEVALDVLLIKTQGTTTDLGMVYTTKQFMDVGGTQGMSRATVTRWISRMIEEGQLEQLDRGRYRRPSVN